MRMSNFGLWKSANAVAVMFDVTSRPSFTSCDSWLQTVNLSVYSTALIVLVGNKIDREDERMVDKEEAEKFAKRHDMEYYETSAATQIGVEQLFHAIAQALLEKEQSQQDATKAQRAS